MAQKKANNQKRRVFVFGGARGIGFWFARKVLSKALAEYEIFLCDTHLPKTIEPGSDFHWKHVSYKDGYIEEFPEDLSSDDVVILSVPVSKLSELLMYLGRHIKGAVQVINFSSIQHLTNSQIVTSLPNLCVVYGIHLLFGPSVSHPAGNFAIVTDLDPANESQAVQSFLEMVKRSGLLLDKSSSLKHDEMMRVLQVGVHYVFFGFAEYLRTQKIDLGELLRYRTLPAGFFLSFMARALSQPKLTYANIQLQETADTARKRIIEAFVTLDEKIEKNNVPTELESILRDIADSFNDEDLSEGVAATSAAVRAHEIASRQVHENITSRRLVGVTVGGDSDEGELKIGYFVREEKGIIEFENVLFLLPDKLAKGERQYALFENQEAENYYSSIGAHRRKGTLKLSKRRIRILTNEYVDQWVKDNVVLGETSFPISLGVYDKSVVEKLPALMKERLPAIHELQISNAFIETDGTVKAVCFVWFHPIVGVEQLRDAIVKQIGNLTTLRLAF